LTKALAIMPRSQQDGVATRQPFLLSAAKAKIMRRRRFLLVLVPVLLSVRVGHAESVDAKERRARTACLAGDHAKGVQLLSELFVTTMDATFIYNQGRCFEQNRRYEDAIARFQEYLRAGRKLTRADKAEAKKHIDDCKELLANEKAQVVRVAPAAPPPVAPATVAPAAVVTTPAAPSSQPNPPAHSDTGSGLRVAGIVMASVGGAALVAGIILNLKVNSLASDLKNTDGYSPGKESDRKTYETLGWVGYGAGAACIATGALLYVLGSRSGGDAQVAFAPAVAPDYAGAVVKGVF
jgi:hypothetical protein